MDEMTESDDLPLHPTQVPAHARPSRRFHLPGIQGRDRRAHTHPRDRSSRQGNLDWLKKSPYTAEYLVHYVGGWQRPLRPIAFRGYQGIRYLDTVSLQSLDSEKW